MANEQNLKPSEYQLTQEEAKKGGRNSVKTRRKKKSLKNSLEMIMKMQIPADNMESLNEDLQKLGIDTTDFTIGDLMALAQVANAVKGNQYAFGLIRDTIGEKPVEEQKVTADTNFKVEITGFDN